MPASTASATQSDPANILHPRFEPLGKVKLFLVTCPRTNLSCVKHSHIDKNFTACGVVER